MNYWRRIVRTWATPKTMASVALLCASMVVAPANAAPVFDPARTGIDGLDIGGTLYDVTFTTNSTFPDLFGSPPNFTFTTQATASTAAAAIVAFLNSNAGRENLSTTINPAPLFQLFVIPYEFSNPAQTIINARAGQGQDLPTPQWSIPVTPDRTFSIFQTLGENTSSGNYWTTFQPSPVPTPSALLLMGSGLFGLVAWRWWSTKTI